MQGKAEAYSGARGLPFVEAGADSDGDVDATSGDDRNGRAAKRTVRRSEDEAKAAKSQPQTDVKSKSKSGPGKGKKKGAPMPTDATLLPSLHLSSLICPPISEPGAAACSTR